MRKVIWWATFLMFWSWWFIGTLIYYLMFPFRIVQVEEGKMADIGFDGMKEMVGNERRL